jgi:hypothetical protein
MTIWVLTEEYNDYDQHGAYYVKAWDHKPDVKELIATGVSEGDIEHVLKGGGRVRYEYQWYLLEEQK